MLTFASSGQAGHAWGPLRGGCPADGQLIPVLLFNNGMRALPPEAKKILAVEHPSPKAGGRLRMLSSKCKLNRAHRNEGS